MKPKKNALTISISLAVLVIAGMLIYSHFSSKSGAQAVTTVEVIDPIAASFDQGALDILADPSKVINFRPTISLDKLGNPAPFGPLH